MSGWHRFGSVLHVFREPVQAVLVFSLDRSSAQGCSMQLQQNEFQFWFRFLNSGSGGSILSAPSDAIAIEIVGHKERIAPVSWPQDFLPPKVLAFFECDQKRKRLHLFAIFRGQKTPPLRFGLQWDVCGRKRRQFAICDFLRSHAQSLLLKFGV